jgi:hypothetical protein
MARMIEAFAAALLLGGINTLADFISSEMRLQAKPIYMFARIALICYCVGGIVGARAKQLMIGTIGGVMIGALVAGAYYFLAPSMGTQSALGVAWALFWISFSLLDALMQGGASFAGALFQGAVAAVLSAGFYLALNGFWPKMSSNDDLWLLKVGTTWAAAFFPGFVVLFWRRL